MRTRAERRHHHQRMLNRVKNFSMYKSSYIWAEEDKLKHQRKMAETRKPCSCDVCCNPRNSGFAKGDRLTMQEKRIMESINDEYSEE